MEFDNTDQEHSLKSAASSETLVSIASFTTVQQYQRSTEASFYRPGMFGDDEMSPLDQMFYFRRDSKPGLSHGEDYSPPLEAPVESLRDTFPRTLDRSLLDLSPKMTWTAVQRQTYRNQSARTLRLDDQDALPHSSHRTYRKLVAQLPPTYTEATEAKKALALLPKEQPLYNVIILGTKDIGKQEFITRFLTSRFDKILNWRSNFPKTDYHTQIEVDGSTCMIQLTGVDDRNSHFDERIKHADALILMYSIFNRSSFDRIRDVHAQISEMRSGTRIPFLLFGNKSNEHNYAFESVQVQVSRDDGTRLAKDLGCSFIEASGTRRGEVRAAITGLLRALRQRKFKAPEDLDLSGEELEAQCLGPELPMLCCCAKH